MHVKFYHIQKLNLKTLLFVPKIVGICINFFLLPKKYAKDASGQRTNNKALMLWEALAKG